jgi:hypothetical protein
MIKYTLAILILSSFLFGVTLSCSCMQVSLRDDFKQSSLVFAGRVLSITQGQNEFELIIRFRVRKWFKGHSGHGREIEVTTCSSSACCGFSFTEGGNYIVFASGTGRYANVSLCSNTREFNMGTYNTLSRY